MMKAVSCSHELLLLLGTSVHKCGKWKPETDNQTLPSGVKRIVGWQKKYNIQSNIKDTGF